VPFSVSLSFYLSHIYLSKEPGERSLFDSYLRLLCDSEELVLRREEYDFKMKMEQREGIQKRRKCDQSNRRGNKGDSSCEPQRK
jgi:hypothetical protein